MKVTIIDGSRNGTREAEAKVDDERIVEFLMTRKDCGGPKMPDHESKPSEWWKGYQQALLDIVRYYDLGDIIMDDDMFNDWLAEDEQERRGL